MQNELMTVQEMSGCLRVHPKTIYKWTDEGKLPFIKVNGLIRFNKSEIEKWQKRSGNETTEFLEFLPKLDFSLEKYDKLMLKGGRALGKKASKRWNYGFGGVFTRKTKAGVERLCIWYYDEKRRRVQKVIKNATSRQEAVLALHVEVSNAFKSEYRNETKLQSISFSAFSDLYIENYAQVKKKSWKSDQKYLQSQLVPFFGEMLLSEIKALHVNQFMVKRQNDGVRNSTINRELTVLKKMLNLAIEWNFDIDNNPVKKGNFFPENEYKRDRVLSIEEEKRLRNETAPHLKAILTCALSTGMRLSEVLGLRWSEVDLKKRQITIQAQSSKSGKLRVIPVNGDLYSSLESLRQLNAGRSGNVFLYEEPKTGKFRPIKTVRRAFERACSRAGIKNLRFHDLRHTFGSRLIERGADPVSVKDLLGHASLKTTEIYLHSSIDRMRKAVALLDSRPSENVKNLEELLRICNAENKEGRGGRASVFFSVN